MENSAPIRRLLSRQEYTPLSNERLGSKAAIGVFYCNLLLSFDQKTPPIRAVRPIHWIGVELANVTIPASGSLIAQ